MADAYTKKGTDVATYVKRQFGDESGVQITDNDIKQWINIAQLDLAQENDFSKKIGTTDLKEGQTDYLFPEHQILYAQTIYVGPKVLKFLTYQEFQEYVQKQDNYDTRVAETPEVWTEWGGTFTLWPKPKADREGAIKFYFIAKPDDIQTLSDNLTVPDRLFSVLLKMVMVHAYQLDEQFDAANLHSQNAANDLGRMAYTPESSSSNEYSSMTILEPDQYGWE